ncbi:hypothetical protein LINPERPRIM_LOCUS39484 [Linum perenne]
MAGRIRSALPLLNRIARSDSHITAAHRSILSPAFHSPSESSRNYATAAAPPKEVKIKVLLTHGTPSYSFCTIHCALYMCIQYICVFARISDVGHSFAF